MKHRSVLMAMMVAAFVAPTGLANAAPPAVTPEARVQAIVEPSIVYIETYYKAYVRVTLGSYRTWAGPYEWASRCTGFVVNPNGHIVTAGHCVDTSKGANGAARTAIGRAVVDKFGSIATEQQQQELFTYGLDNWKVAGTAAGAALEQTVLVARGVATSGLKSGQAFKARVLTWSPLEKGDVALLKVEEANLPSLQLAPDADVQVGTQVLSVGYPGSSDEVTDQSLTPTLKAGQINSKKTRDNGALPVYEMDAALSGGMSGGPTVDMQGRVIGLNSFSISGETEAFNWLSPSSLISETLGRADVQNVLGPVDKAYRQGLKLYFAGDGKGAVKQFDIVLNKVPSFAKAQEFKSKAVELAATQKSFPIVLVLIVVIVIAGGAGGFLFLRSRRSKKAPAEQVTTLGMIPQLAGYGNGNGNGGPSVIDLTEPASKFATVTVVPHPVEQQAQAAATVVQPISQPVAEEPMPARPVAELVEVEPVAEPIPMGRAPKATRSTSTTAAAKTRAPRTRSSAARSPKAGTAKTSEGRAEAARAKFCPECGQPTEGAKFCPNCGHGL